MRKKITLITVLLTMLILLAGCYETSIRMDFDSEGNMSIKSGIAGDTMTRKEDMDLVYWQLKTIFPELSINYRTEQEGKNIQFEKIDKISQEKIEHIEFKKQDDGSFNFEMVIPAIYSEKDDSDDLFLDIEIILPKEIDMANTTDVEKNRARWSIRERDIHKEINLRAFTIAE